MLEPNDDHRVPSGSVLIGLADPASIVPMSDGATTQPSTQRTDFVDAALSVAIVGKGRILCCLWRGYHNDP